MNPDDNGVVARIVSDIKSIRESFSKPTTETAKSLSEMSGKIAAGMYLVTQHMSDKTTIKMSMRKSADELIDVVYSVGGDTEYGNVHNIITVADKIMSFISLARISGLISDTNGLLLEREVLKMVRLASLVVVRGDAGSLLNLSRDRHDVRLKMLDIFDSETTEVRKPKQKMSDRNTDNHPVSIAVVNTVKPIEKIEDIGHANKSENKNEEISTVRVQKEDSFSKTKIEVEASTAPVTIHNLTASEVPQQDVAKDQVRVTPTSDSSVRSTPTPTLEVVDRNYSQYASPRTNTKPGPSVSDTGASPMDIRRKQVLRYIRENGIVSIKDIADSISGVSEKTLQRTLIDLVLEGVVVRHGDRRWSRYEAVL